MPDQKFKRTKEDFLCEHCHQSVTGDGFTNHCPACLWSKHVDVHPGDRSALCGGSMEPREVLKDGDEWKITHVCTVCGYRKKNRTQKEDSFGVLVALAEKITLEKSKGK